jgi:hypothetical protein
MRPPKRRTPAGKAGVRDVTGSTSDSCNSTTERRRMHVVLARRGVAL